MSAIPWELFAEHVKEAERPHTGVGMVFLPQDPAMAKQAMGVIEGTDC